MIGEGGRDPERVCFAPSSTVTAMQQRLATISRRDWDWDEHQAALSRHPCEKVKVVEEVLSCLPLTLVPLREGISRGP